jgi:hypothetical protein
MMEENSLSIPFAPEIPATNRLGCSVPNRITSHAREDQRHINNEAEVIPKSKQKSTSRSQRQSGSTSSRPSSTSITASQTTASVNGNRIRRGAGHSRRVTSERVSNQSPPLLMYLIKPLFQGDAKGPSSNPESIVVNRIG